MLTNLKISRCSGNTPKSPPVAINNPRKTRSSLDSDDPAETISARLFPSSHENGAAKAKGIHEGDPDSPTSQALVRAARRTLEEAEACSTPERRFNFLEDIARNPRLAEAARLELELDGISGNSSPGAPFSSRSMGSASGQTNLGMQTSNTSGGVTYFAHSNEVERQAALIMELDAEAVQESKINQGMATVMLGRLSSGKAAAERVLSVLQAFASAEAAYARAMDALARVALPGEADGGTMRAAMCEFSALPASLGSLHSGVAEALSPIIRAVQTVVVELRSTSEDISTGARSAQKKVDAARKGMKSALAAHRDACKAFDATLVDQGQSSSYRSRPVDADPWIAEGRLVEKQAALQAAQTYQRRYLAGAFRRAGELERRRIEITCTALTALMELPRTTSLPEVATAWENLSAALSAVDREGDLEAFSAVAQNSVRNGDALSTRQAELVDHLWVELNTSAEIVRQGEVQRFDSAKDEWRPGYAVLTRAGFLHWFNATGHGQGTGAWTPVGGPVSSLNLARCEFEQGYAPAWRLIDSGSGGLNSWLGVNRTSLSLRTTGVEACMDWAADLRELISACSSK